MRVENWNPNVADQTFEDIAMDRLLDAAKVLAANVRQRCPVGTVSRPMYKTGPYAGEPWTARDKGQLRKSVRVVQKLSKSGKPLMSRKNVRVYCGHYLAYYASIVEFSKPFMRPSFEASVPAIKSIIGAR
jgi:hypothetical protein